MVTWIDIVSIRLRTVHQQWAGFRENRKTPHMDCYDYFAKLPIIDLSSNCSVVLLASSDRARWPVVHAGSVIRKMLPNVQPGKNFEAGQLPYARIGLANWPFATARIAEPNCERGHLGYGDEQWDFEVLILPFINDQQKEGLVHTVFDIPRTVWKGIVP